MESIIKLEKKYSDERRPREALEAVQNCAAGNIKIKPAKQKILDCHAFAKDIECMEDIAVCHAIGYPIYDLTAVIYRLGIENCEEAVERRKQEYTDKLLYWNEHLCDYQSSWADFMLK